jgi:uncharacterized membrane protein
MLEKTTKEYIDSKVIPIIEINQLKSDTTNKNIMVIIMVVVFAISLVITSLFPIFILMAILSGVITILIYKEVIVNTKKLKKLKGELKNV